MNRPKILIVDDRPENLIVLEEILEKVDVEVVSASSGAEALEQVVLNTFAVILLDVQMPVMDGFQTAQEIYACCDEIPPIIFVTALSNEKVNVTQGYKSGAVDYLSKPLEPEYVRAKVLIFLELYEQKRLLQEVNSKLACFARMVCHDASQPLASMVGLSEIVLDEYKKEMPDKAIEYIQFIFNEGKRLGTMLADLHSYSRSDEEIKDNLIMVDLNKIIAEVIEALRNQITKADAIIEIDSLGNVQGGETEFRVAFQNIISNGIKYVKKGVIPKMKIYFETDKSSAQQILFIKDNGIGIKEEDLKIIFEPFKRLVTTSKYPGTGLGLATCKRLLNYVKSDVSVTSVLDKGSLFKITFNNQK